MRFIQVLLAAALMAAASHTFAADCEPQTQIDVSTIKPRVILVGEMHGTEQAPAFVGDLVCSLLKAGRPVILALERFDNEQQALSQYIDSEGIPADRDALIGQGMWSWPMQDGRSSVAVLALIEKIRQLRHAGQPVGLLAMQHSVKLPLQQLGPQAKGLADGLSSRMNDRFMADALAGAASAYGNYTIVALAGNLHTSTKPSSWSAPGYQPMAQVLGELLPTFVIGLNASEGGSSWFCTGPNDCGAHKVLPGPLYAAEGQIDAVAQIGKVSASPPAKPASPGH